MAEAFIGMTVSVVLKTPSHATLTGKIVGIQGHILLMNNVYSHESGRYFPSWSIPSPDIADLQVIDAQTAARILPSRDAPIPIERPSQSILRQQMTLDHQAVSPARPTANMVDPAILSYHRPPSTVVANTPVEISTSSPRIPPVEIGDSLPLQQMKDLDLSLIHISEPTRPY